MFDRLKKALGKGTHEATHAVQGAGSQSRSAHQDMLDWGLALGLKDAQPKDEKTFAMTGLLAGKPWKIECSRSTRDYIVGTELRARAELKVNEDAAVLIFSRPLKDALEKRAYEMYTDTLQTTADPGLPEEMRWLAMYPEADWPGMSRPFKSHFVALSGTLDHAVNWIDEELSALLTVWPKPGLDDRVPFILMLLRGKAYLRMQFKAGDVDTLEHATKIFTKACSSAMAMLPAGN